MTSFVVVYFYCIMYTYVYIFIHVFIARLSNDAFLLLFSYRQNLAVDFVVAELAFESLDKFYEFVNELGLVYADPEHHLIDCKTSSGSIGAW